MSIHTSHVFAHVLPHFYAHVSSYMSMHTYMHRRGSAQLRLSAFVAAFPPDGSGQSVAASALAVGIAQLQARGLVDIAYALCTYSLCAARIWPYAFSAPMQRV